MCDIYFIFYLSISIFQYLQNVGNAVAVRPGVSYLRISGRISKFIKIILFGNGIIILVYPFLY